MTWYAFEGSLNKHMKQYDAKSILNIAIAGHSGAGKTSLAEAMLFLSGATDRLGKVSDGNTVCDYDPEEIKRKATVMTAVAPVEWQEKKLNFIDAPGLFDFEGGVCEAVRAADTVLVTIHGKSGVAVGSEKAVKAADARGLAKVFFINGLCDENADFYAIFDALKEKFGTSVCPVVIPYVVNGKADTYINIVESKAYTYKNGKMSETAMPDFDRMDDFRAALYEAVAETSDELMEKYFAEEPFTPEEIIEGVSKGARFGLIAPVFCGDPVLLQGIDLLLNGLCDLAPTAHRGTETGEDPDGNPVEIAVNEADPAAAIVFKTIADPFVGKLSYIKVLSGKISTETALVNMRTGNPERIGKTLFVCGKKQEETKAICAGDIGAIPKLSGTNTGDTLCAPTRKVILEGIKYPTPTITMAVLPKKKGEEDKVAQGILRLVEEDPTIHFANNAETHQMTISGLGEQHLDVISSKLKSKFGVEVTIQKPKVAYRETIRKKVQVQGRHKKQSGGHGQFGDVWIEFEPCDSESLEFGERVVGGAVPKNFFPAVEKGLRDCIQKGTLAGYPMVGLRATLYDGSYHPVDSSEMSFKMAASIAYKNGIPQANPVLLEPIGTLKATVPDANMGDVMGEVNKRRGRVLGMNPAEERGYQTVEAEVPMAEMHDFCTFIRQCTQGRGNFTFDFVRYEEAPAPVAKKVIEAAASEAGDA